MLDDFQLNYRLKVAKNNFWTNRMAGFAISSFFFLIRWVKILIQPKFGNVEVSTNILITSAWISQIEIPFLFLLEDDVHVQISFNQWWIESAKALFCVYFFFSFPFFFISYFAFLKKLWLPIWIFFSLVKFLW